MGTKAWELILIAVDNCIIAWTQKVKLTFEEGWVMKEYPKHWDIPMEDCTNVYSGLIWLQSWIFVKSDPRCSQIVCIQWKRF